ncbi:DUF58 domain-containing protein [Nakamurella leprariae]|uniref:DUF58 domain-containing protein n=1 Tax=Nakamurella leprariae TaxID=2803911 RepID=A0A939C0H6_9ACTN|nr:DUF58 domain-containing protein [Nakamurella leprariae]MBM9469240.1 DUF58 domain-containing protein [Nakamurella leprariae]
MGPGKRPRSTRDGWRSISGLTTRGRCLLAGGLAAVVCAVVLDERDLLRIGLFAALFPILAWLVMTLHRTRLAAAHRVLPDRLAAGSTGTVELTVTNSGVSRSASCELGERPTPDLTAGLRATVPGLRAGHSAVTRYPAVAVRRGRFVVGPPRIRIGDPFGMWESTRMLPARTEVLVVPTVEPLIGAPPGPGTLSAASERTPAGESGGDPDITMRPYRDGDDIRAINWRASARHHDELMVRLHEPASHGGATVLLDHRVAAFPDARPTSEYPDGIGGDPTFERAVSAAASLTLHLAAEDHRVRLVTHTDRVLADGHDIADDVLGALAVLGADRTSWHPVRPAHPGLVVAVLGELDVRTARMLTSTLSRAGTLVAVVVSEHDGRTVAPPPPEGITVMTAAGWRVTRWTRDEPLAAAWQRVCPPRHRPGPGPAVRMRPAGTAGLSGAGAPGTGVRR